MLWNPPRIPAVFKQFTHLQNTREVFQHQWFVRRSDQRLCDSNDVPVLWVISGRWHAVVRHSWETYLASVEVVLGKKIQPVTT
jgi:hypothetical protein